MCHATLPCLSRRPAGRALPSTACRAALLAPRRPALPTRRPAGRRAALPCLRAALLAAALPCQLRHPALAFDTWLDELQLYLLSDSRDGVSLFDLTSGASLAPPATADSATHSQWLTRDAAARLAVRNHLPLAERAHFGQHKTAKALYDAVFTRHSSPATAALGRLMLPYLFPELYAFATVDELITQLRTSDTRYRAALPTKFLDENPPPMYITLYFIVTRLPDSLSAVKYLFLAMDPTDLTVDLLEKHLLAVEASIVGVGAARGTPRTPFFEGCSPSPLAPSFASTAGVEFLRAEQVAYASAPSGRRRSGKGKEGKGGGGGGGDGGGEGSGGGSGGVGGGGGGGSGSGGGGSGGSSGSGGGCSGGGRGGAGQRGGSGGGHRQQHQRPRETLMPQELQFPNTTKLPRWLELLRQGVDIFALDYDATLVAMYASTVSAEGDCYLCVPPDPGIEAAALGASESALLGTAPGEALHTFTIDSGASRCFFRDSTTVTPLPPPIAVRLADPSGGPVLARSSIVLPCPAVPSGSLSGLHLPSFSTNLVSTAALQDAMVTTTTPGGQRVSICTCTRSGRHLATFTRLPGSSPYILTNEPPQVAASAQVSASGLVAAPCSCRFLTHQTLLRHNCLGHPSLPRLRGMHYRLLVSGLPRSLPPLPPLPAPPCLPCVEGWQHAAPHSLFPPTTAPLQTLHMDVWGPARVRGQGRERYFLLVVDDYSRYTMVFPLPSKGEVPDFFIPWIRAVLLQLRERFRLDLPVLRLHYDRGGEFASDLLRNFCRGEGIRLSFTLPASPQQTWVVERRIGLVVEVARTSMIHAATPHFLWPFAVQYAAHQLNLWPRVSLSETSPTQRWTGEVGDASVFRVWGSRAFVRDTSADKLSSHAIPCVFLGFPPDAHGWQFYQPTTRRVLPSQDITFDESVPFYRVSQVDPLSLSEPVEVAVDSGAAGGGAARGVASGVAEPECVEPGGAELGVVESEGAEPGGAEPQRAEPGGNMSARGPTGASSRREPFSPSQLREWFAWRTRLRSGIAGAGGPAAGGSGVGGTGAVGLRGACNGGTGAGGAGGAPCAGARDPGAGGTGAGGTRGAGAAGPGGARTEGTRDAGAGGAVGDGAGDPGAGGAGARDHGAACAGAGDPGAGGAGPRGAGAIGTNTGGTVQLRPFFVPVLRQVHSLLSSTGLNPPLLCPPPDQSQPHLQPVSPLHAPSPYTEQTDSPTEGRAPKSRHALPVRVVCTSRRVPCPHPPPIPGTHIMALCPSSVPLRVPLPSPPASDLADDPHPEFDLVRAASPTVPRLLAPFITGPLFESTAASALVAELVDFAAACCLDYAASLVAESESPPSVEGECALGTDVLEDRQEDFECLAAAVPHLVAMLLAPEGDPDASDISTPRSYAEAIEGPYSSQWQTDMDAEMASWKSTCTYVDAVSPLGANIVNGMWIFRVKRPSGSPSVFKARYVARGFSQR
ncbi:unnamed protein product [Closterium sp. NIES-54]